MTDKELHESIIAGVTLGTTYTYFILKHLPYYNNIGHYFTATF